MPRDAAPHAAGWRARLSLGFERRGARTVLASRRHDGPLVVQKPLHPEGDSPCHAIVVHPPAGIAGGDELLLEVAAQDRAAVLLTTPGAAKWYRSAGAWARQRVTIEAGPDSRVEWLPQENIVYDGALADLAWEARLAAEARVVAWEIMCLGRTASGERFSRGRCRIAARVYREGRLAWSERATIDPGSPLAEAAPGLAGASVFGTMLIAAPSIEDAWLAAAREEAPREGEAAATRLPGLLLARYRGRSSEAAREYFAAIWRRVRAPVMGRPAIDPRIWST